jgi:hypothetical protein
MDICGKTAQAAAGLHVSFDLEQKTRYGRIVMPFADDIEGLQQRYAGLQHGGELAREQGDVFVGDLAAAGGAFLDLGDSDALTAQLCRNTGFAHPACIAFDNFAGLILAFPAVLDFLALARFFRSHL